MAAKKKKKKIIKFTQHLPTPVATQAGNLLPRSTDFTNFVLKDKKIKLDTHPSKNINPIIEHSRFESLSAAYMENPTNNFSDRILNYLLYR